MPACPLIIMEFIQGSKELGIAQQSGCVAQSIRMVCEVVK